MKNIILIISLSVLTACSMRGFEPPRSTNYWRLPGNDLTLDEYIDKKIKNCENVVQILLQIRIQAEAQFMLYVWKRRAG